MIFMVNIVENYFLKCYSYIQKVLNFLAAFGTDMGKDGHLVSCLSTICEHVSVHLVKAYVHVFFQLRLKRSCEFISFT